MTRPFFPPVNRKQAAAKKARATEGKRSFAPTKPLGKPLEAGRRFGFLTVIGPAPARMGGALFLCRCDCGEEVKVRRVLLRTGAVRSCGAQEHRRKRPPRQDGYVNDLAAARAYCDREEAQKAAQLYPKDRTPPPRESDFALWKDRWME